MLTVLPGVALDLDRPAPQTISELFLSRSRLPDDVFKIGGRELIVSPITPPVTEVWLEIGFGGGEHLVWQAEHNPGVGLIGCEPFEDGVGKVLSVIAAHRPNNIRLHMDDARPLLRWLPVASIARAFVLFPDPWPKKKHQKRRLVNGPLLAMLARVMKPGAQLRIGTDIADYARTIFMAIQAQDALAWTAATRTDWHIRPDDWPETRYEQKARREGRPCCYLRFVRS